MEQPKKANFKYLLFESYLAYLKNSVGTQMFRNYYVKQGDKIFDVLEDGNLSCAVYASTVLRNFGVVDKLHFTVARTVDDLLTSGAKKIPANKIKPGDVLVWLPEKTKSGWHNHIGFYLGNKQAVSNSEKKKKVVKHDYLFKGKRKIELALRPDWNKKYAKS